MSGQIKGDVAKGEVLLLECVERAISRGLGRHNWVVVSQNDYDGSK
jgi:hypothetical protein